MSKKAITQNELVLLIFILAVMIVLAAGVYLYVKQIRTTTGIEGCRESILFQQTVTSTSKGTLGKTKINCPAPAYTISSNNKNTIMRAIADQLYDCWYKTLGSKNKLGTNMWFVDWVAPDDAYCLVCSEFTVSQTIQPAEFLSFLETSKPKSSAFTYAQALADSTLGWDKVLLSTPSAEAIGEWGKTPIAIIPKNVNKFTNSIILQSTPPVENRYYVLSFNWGEGYNQPIILEQSKIPNIKCDIFEYKPAG